MLLVFGRHLMPLTNDGPRVVLRFAQTWHRAAIGTDIFFVLSGFLVSGLLFREFQRHHRLDTRRFLLRRGFKIYPAYFFYLLASIPLALLLGEPSPTAGQVAAHTLLVQNYYPHYLAYWAHLWSLGVEEHFYLAIAAAMILAPKLSANRADPFRWIPSTFLFAATACLIARCLLASTGPFGFYRNYLPTHLRLDSLLFGVFLAYAFHFHREVFVRRATRYRRPLLLAGLAGLLPAFCIGPEAPFSFTIGFTLCFLATGALITVAVVTPIHPETRLARIATFLATRSYSIYLWHLLTFFTVRYFFIHYAPELGKLWLFNTATTVTAALLVGTLMHALVEAPALRLRDRLFPTRSRRPPPQKQKEPLESEELSNQPVLTAS